MRKAVISLSRGLTLNYSELSVPFVIKRLPLWPKPGEGWAPHPGIVPYNESALGYQPGDEFTYSDTSGLLVVRRDIEIVDEDTVRREPNLIVRDLLRGEVARGVPESAGNELLGVVLPRTGWYRSRHNYIFPGAPGGMGINLRPLRVVPGSLDRGSYRIWALTYIRLPTGLLFLWYSVLTATLNENGQGLRIRLAEKPGHRVVRLYVQRLLGNWTPLTYLGELTGDEDTFTYTSHLQEGAAEEIAITKAIGKHAAYYNGRYFYQSDQLTVLGRGAPQRAVVGEPIGNRPSSGFFLTYQDGLLISEVVENASPLKFAPFGEWDAGVETEQGLFVAVRVDEETHIYHTPSGRGYNAWSLVYKLNTPVRMRWAAASPSRVVFVADGLALVGNLSNYLSPAGWRQVTLPSSSPIKRLMWTSGGQFAAIVDGALLLGGADATNWEVKAPPDSGDFRTFIEWKDFTYAARPGKFFILAAQPLGGGEFFIRTFTFNGNTWTSHDFPKANNLNGVVHRRFATVWSDGDNIVGFGLGVKGQIYWDACLPIPVGVPEMDWFGFFRADQFPRGCAGGDFLGEAKVVPPARLWSSNDSDDYGTLHKWDGGIGGAFVRGGQYRRWLIRYNTSTRRVEVYGPDPPVNIKGVPTLLRSQVWLSNHPDRSYRYTTSILGNVPAFASINHSDIAYSVTSAFMRLSENLTARRFNIEGAPAGVVIPLGVANENDNAAVLIRRYSTLTDPPSEILLVGNPPSFAQVNLGTAPGPLEPEYVYNGIRTDGIKVYYTNQYRTFVVNGADVQSYNVGGASVVTNGSRWYVVGQTGINEITSSGLIPKSTEAYIGAVDGSGVIYGVKVSGASLEVVEIDTATWATTSLGTIPGTSFRGGYIVNDVLTIATYDGSTLRVMFYDNGWKTAYSLNTPHPVVGFIGGPVSPGGGDSGGGSEAADFSYQVDLPPNTIVWTDVGHINQTTPYAYQTFVPRTSNSVTAITEHPAGVMVFMENEAFIMAGRFTSLADTRVSLYPQAVGADKGTRITRVGSTIFTTWNGRLFALGDGEVALISRELTDDSPFVAVAYDPVHAMLVARKENGRTYRYDVVRKVWFDDIDGTLDLVQLANGVLYVREYTAEDSEPQIGLFRLAGGNERVEGNPLYYRPRPEVWIESARMHIIGNAVDLTPVKRLRAVYLQMRSEGPPNPHIEVYNEAGALVAGGDMIPTLTSNTFGIARYHFRFPPVVTFAPERIAVSFAGVRFILANDIEVHYEARERRI
jgi:hypothetical protein